MKQTWKYCTEREAELFRSLSLSRWPTASIFCNPFPAKEGKDVVQQTGSLLGAAQQCSLCLIPKISLETGSGKCNWGRTGPGTAGSEEAAVVQVARVSEAAAAAARCRAYHAGRPSVPHA